MKTIVLLIILALGLLLGHQHYVAPMVDDLGTARAQLLIAQSSAVAAQERIESLEESRKEEVELILERLQAVGDLSGPSPSQEEVNDAQTAVADARLPVPESVEIDDPALQEDTREYLRTLSECQDLIAAAERDDSRPMLSERQIEIAAKCKAASDARKKLDGTIRTIEAYLRSLKAASAELGCDDILAIDPDHKECSELKREIDRVERALAQTSEHKEDADIVKQLILSFLRLLQMSVCIAAPFSAECIALTIVLALMDSGDNNGPNRRPITACQENPGSDRCCRDQPGDESCQDVEPPINLCENAPGSAECCSEEPTHPSCCQENQECGTVGEYRIVRSQTGRGIFQVLRQHTSVPVVDWDGQIDGRAAAACRLTDLEPFRALENNCNADEVDAAPLVRRLLVDSDAGCQPITFNQTTPMGGELLCFIGAACGYAPVVFGITFDDTGTQVRRVRQVRRDVAEEAVGGNDAFERLVSSFCDR